MREEADDSAWFAGEAKRLHARYVNEVVVAFGLCPWAAPALAAGRTRELVVMAGRLDEAERGARNALAMLGADEAVEVGFVIFPAWDATAAAFDAFVARIGGEASHRFPLGKAPLAFAPFHPDAPCDDATPERLVPFLRRTPSPTIQAVRVSVLERVRRNHGHGTELVDVAALDEAALLAALEQVPLAAEVARVNHDALQRSETRQRLVSVLDDIARDRARVLAGLHAR